VLQLPNWDHRRGLSRSRVTFRPGLSRGQNRRNPLVEISPIHYQQVSAYAPSYALVPVRSIRSVPVTCFSLKRREMLAAFAPRKIKRVLRSGQPSPASAAAVEPQAGRLFVTGKEGPGQAESERTPSKAIHPHFGSGPAAGSTICARRHCGVIQQALWHRLPLARIANVAFGISTTRPILKFAALDCFQISTPILVAVAIWSSETFRRPASSSLEEHFIPRDVITAPLHFVANVRRCDTGR